MAKVKLNYDDNTAQDMKILADSAMSSTQEKIEHLNSMSNNALNSTFNNLLNWQTWIATISFTLAAIGGTVLINTKETANGFVLVSLLLFLITGLWVMLFQKRVYEYASVNASKDVNVFKPLYDNKKKAAWQFYQDPHSVEKHLNFLRCELTIMEETHKLETEQLNTIKTGKTDYRNDIWLSLLVSAVYFMLQPTGQKLYSQSNLMGSGFNYIFWLIWLLFMLIILNSALKGTKDVKVNTLSQKLKLEGELKHTEEYTTKIREQIKSIESL